MTVISIYDLTDELLAPPIDLTPDPDPAPWTGWYPGKPREAKATQVRRCTGCGIDTTLPDLCRDCTDSGWFA